MSQGFQQSVSAIHERIDGLDVTLFRTVETQSAEDDLRSFLAIQSACRQWKGAPFSVLEIGSFKGGSLQALVADPACEGIVSIDPRPSSVADERGSLWDYSLVSAQDMLALLSGVPGANTSKVKTITSGTDSLSAADVGSRPDYCFIDGAHTDDAVLRDAHFCLEAAAPDCAIAFHDADIVYRALQTLVGELKAQGRRFRAYNLASVIFVIELGECRLSEQEPLRSWRDQNYEGYLDSLGRNDHFRQTALRYERLMRHPFAGVFRRLGIVALAKKLFGVHS